MKRPRSLEESLNNKKLDGDGLSSLDDSTMDISDISSFEKGGVVDDSTIVNDKDESSIKLTPLPRNGDGIPIPPEWVELTWEQIRKYTTDENIAKIIFGKMCYWYPDLFVDEAIQDSRT